MTRSTSTQTDRPLGLAALGPLFSVFLQFGLVVLVMRRADILTPGFRRLLLIALSGFLVHHLTPLKYRMHVFAGICLTAAVTFLGWSSSDQWSAWLAVQRFVPLAAAGAILTAICLLPIAFWLRSLVLAAAAGVAAAFRADLLPSGTASVIWPVLAALFMFRVISYLYQTSVMEKRPGVAQSVAYFSLLTNLTVGLFPVVDFKAFVRSHYSEDAIAIYQRGVNWMVRGVVQLMIYRVVQQLWSLSPSDVHSGATLVQFIVANMFLYLKVSGQFHLFVGLLLLFGFNLPESNRRYFLASSFTDYWRRVNIYWKDFILSVFYYPAYFRLKHRGPTVALVAATAWCFFVTWALHLYQTWWLTGSVSVTWPDSLFWGTLGALVIINSLWETTRGRRRRLSGGHTWPSALGLTARTMLTFATMSLLWSLWSSPSLPVWLGLWRYADASAAFYATLVLLAIAAATIVFEILPSIRPAAARKGTEATFASSAWPFARSVATLAAVYVVCTATFQTTFASRDTQPWFDAINAGTSVADPLIAGNGGYYERLTQGGSGNNQLWEAVMGRTMPYSYAGAEPTRPVHDLRFIELKPNISMDAFDTHIRTNRWGMRDKDYNQRKPAGVFRIALVGSSHALGWAVPEDAVFETIVEDRLNRERPAGSRVSFEVLNFSTNGRGVLGQDEVIDKWVRPFEPDAVVFIAHSIDSSWLTRDLARATREGVSVPFDLAEGILEQAWITPRTPAALAAQRLHPYEPALLAWGYQLLVNQIRSMNAIPIGVYVPIPIDLPPLRFEPVRTTKQTAALAGAGFHLVDFTSLFDTLPRERLAADEGYFHLSASAHAVLADALYDVLVTNRGINLVGRACHMPRSGPVLDGPGITASPRAQAR